MDSIRTLLLARTHTVILDPDRVAAASTRPARDTDVDRFEDELVQLGFVMSLDLAMTIRRLPQETIAELRSWTVTTLAQSLGAQRPHVPLYPAATPALFARRALSWLLTRSDQPCPWCGQKKQVGALDPCGHLVCRPCWEGGTYSGCPICHRRVSPGSPFIVPQPGPPADPVLRHDGALRVLHLAFDVVTAARARFERLIASATPLGDDDRSELESVIDAMGPRAATWLPARIAVRETMAIVLARLWIVAPDRSAMVRATQSHLRTATDVLRVAAVLMHGDPALDAARPMRLRSIGRALRRAVLEALDRLPADELVEEMRRRAGLWKRAGERLHPFELAGKLPRAALAFAVLRGTDLAAASFGAALREQAATLSSVRIADDRLYAVPWASAVERALGAGDARAAAARLAERPGDVLRRADHLVRVAAARQPAAVGEVLAAIRAAMPHSAPATVLALGAHTAARGAPWPHRVVYSRGRRAWTMPDQRAPLPADAIGAIVQAARDELLERAETRPRFARAVIDRGLAELLWQLAAIHAAARANVVYVRTPNAAIATFRRRDAEPTAARLARILAGEYDGITAAIPTADAPTWVALLRDDVTLPAGSAGYVLDARTLGPTFTRLDAADLLGELAVTRARA